VSNIKHLKNLIYGIILGIAAVIPAFSAGTMAVLLNIFDRIMLALGLKNLRENLSFLVTLGFGALCGVFILSKFMTSLLDTYEMYINYCFIGMIIGCIPMIYRRAKYEKIKKRNIAVFFAALCLMIFIAFKGGGNDFILTMPEAGHISPGVFMWLFLSAAVSAVIAILPGISGTIILLLFGTYTIILEAVSTFYFPVLIPVISGILAGGVVGVIIIKKMLNFHPQALYCGILGLIIGSIFNIYPGFSPDKEGELSVILMAAFLVITYIFSKKGGKP